MSVTARLTAFALRYAFHQPADQLVGWLEGRFTDHSGALPQALNRATDRAWQTLGLALAGDALLGRVSGWFRDRDLTGLRDQIRAFVANTPTGLEATPAELRVRACDELTRLRKAGRLAAPGRDAVHADLSRYADPTGLARDAEQAVGGTADAVESDAPHLARVLRHAPAGGPPLLAAAFVFFFRREVETDDELARGLTFDALRRLSAAHDRGLDLLSDRTAGVLDQLDALFDAIGVGFAAADAKLDDIRAKLDKLLADRDVTRNTAEPLRVSVTTEKELAQLRRWRDDLRKLPPELLDATDWAKLGDALTAGRLLGEAREAHAEAEASARAAADRAAEAEAAYKGYRVACEQEDWAAALPALVRATELDPARFAPFPLNRYEPVRVLGAGGFGTVVLCRERLKRNREVAVKAVFAADLGRDLDELFGEAHTVSGLDDPAIIKVLHWEFADPAETRPYLVMEYFPGPSLAAHLKQHGPLPVADFVPVARNVAAAMAAAHGAGVIHRDLKPANVLLRHDPVRGWDVRVIDFGLAVRLAVIQASASTLIPNRTRRDQSFAGTLEYASPEQKGLVAAAVGPQSDVYSFGKTMLEALLGTTEPTTRTWKSVPEVYRDALQGLLEPCVEKSPADRHPGFAPIVARLATLDAGERATHERLEWAQAEQQRRATEQLAEEERKKREAEEEAKATDPLHPARPRRAGDKVELDLPGDVKLAFAWCPPGTFRMGSEHPEGYPDEKPVHRVTLTRGFYMGTHPITQAMWKAVMGAEPSQFKGPNRPAENMSWDDCQAFCTAVMAHLGSRVTVRLPSEAEWEYACRAGTTAEFHFGDVIRTDLANYNGTSSWNGSPTGKYLAETTDVGSFPANPWGLFDTHGNVWEWCEDWYGPYPVEDQTDPVRREKHSHNRRVMRGGCWNSSPVHCRAAHRYWFAPGHRSGLVGCRVCFHLD